MVISQSLANFAHLALRQLWSQHLVVTTIDKLAVTTPTLMLVDTDGDCQVVPSHTLTFTVSIKKMIDRVQCFMPHIYGQGVEFVSDIID